MSMNFYCEKKCGDVDFSIEEWNKVQEELKTLTPEQLDFVNQPQTICQQQCKGCALIVERTRIKNAHSYLTRAGYNVAELVSEGLNIIDKAKKVRDAKIQK